ncbi:hypothetical protein [Paenibacillus sp. Y412MC10]|uniref:hypothetical protein n=1 Tax=Geobacillus sp. (strain Y412MC10) TaxID=481743 RepID=UPI0011AB7EDB|nr:hypothetical protein [Paenibacillus sp. Y412MC10]
MTVDWKDLTKYKRYDKVRVPNSWGATFGVVDLVVHPYIGIDGWFMSSKRLNISAMSLKSENDVSAKEEAVAKLRNILMGNISDLTQALKEAGGDKLHE